MARNKEYDCQEVLDAATWEFLDRGFKGVSMNELVKATRLNKHSMYQEFGSKEGLFCQCIDNYVHTVGRDFGHILRRQPLGLANIEDFFHNRIDYAFQGKGNGCLLITTVVEKEQVEESVLNRVLHHWTLQKADFQLCLTAAQENGEIPAEKDAKELANYIFCFLIGMVVMLKADSTRESMKMMLKMLMVDLKS